MKNLCQFPYILLRVTLNWSNATVATGLKPPALGFLNANIAFLHSAAVWLVQCWVIYSDAGQQLWLVALSHFKQSLVSRNWSTVCPINIQLMCCSWLSRVRQILNRLLSSLPSLLPSPSLPSLPAIWCPRHADWSFGHIDISLRQTW